MTAIEKISENAHTTIYENIQFNSISQKINLNSNNFST